MNNAANNKTLYCQGKDKKFYVSQDGGQHWTKLISTTLRIDTGEDGSRYVYTDKYLQGRWIDCNDNVGNKNNFQIELDALRALVFNNGARFAWDRRVRLAYDARLKEMKQLYENKIAHKQMTGEEAGWIVKDLRNHYLKVLRRWTHPIGLKKARMRKSDKGLSDEAALKNAIANFEARSHLPKNFDSLPEIERDNIRRPIVKKFKSIYDKNPNRMYEILKKNKAEVFKEMLESASRADSGVTDKFLYPKGLASVEHKLFYMSLIISLFTVLMADDPTTALIEELAIYFVLFVGGFVGGAIGSATICKGSGNAAIYCVVATSMLGGILALEEFDHLRGKQ